MANPSDKAPAITTFLDGLAKDTFGRTRSGTIGKDLCVTCGEDAKVFRDDLSRREYSISGMCQKCQDGFFN